MTKSDLATERKKQIIQATIECISKYGYNNFSMQDVAHIANVSKGIIHYYFLNKEDLMMGVLKQASGDIESLLSDMAERDPLDKLKFVIKTLFSVVQEKREFYCINMDFWTQINQKQTVKDSVANHYSKLRQALANVVQEGMDKGTFVAANSLHTASVIMAIVDGVSLQWLFDEKSFDFETISSDCENIILKFVLHTAVIPA